MLSKPRFNIQEMFLITKRPFDRLRETLHDRISLSKPRKINHNGINTNCPFDRLRETNVVSLSLSKPRYNNHNSLYISSVPLTGSGRQNCQAELVEAPPKIIITVYKYRTSLRQAQGDTSCQAEFVEAPSFPN